MSEYQLVKFETIDTPLSKQQRSELRDISSRAHIDSRSFKVQYNYSSLRADPKEVMLACFDIGFNFANWGVTEVYIKLPAETIPQAVLENDDFEFSTLVNEQWQLLTFSLEQGADYVSEQQADDLMQHIANLRQQMINGDWRMIYLIWLRRLSYDDKINDLPALSFDFVDLTPELHTLSQLFEIQAEWIQALAMTLPQIKCHQTQITSGDKDEFDLWLASISAESKDQLLQTLFEQGSLTKQQALSQTSIPPKQIQYIHWLNHQCVRANYNQAKAYVAQQRSAEKALQEAEETARKERHLTEIYQQRESLWQHTQTEANRGCASGYNLATHYLHELAEAYQLKQQSEMFENRFRKFVQHNQQRKALIIRLTNLMI